MISSFAANEINHFVKGISAYWTWQNFGYNLENAQYVIANSDQVRVRYIVQVKKVSSKQ